MSRTKLGDELQGLLASVVAGCEDCPGVAIRIESAGGEVIFSAAAGTARPDTQAAMTPETPIHVASVAKTFTAALVLQLAEEGRLGPLGLDAPLAMLESFPHAIRARLRASQGGDHAERIRVRHLLSHTSGLRDAMEDDRESCGGPAPGSLIGSLLAPGGDPSRAWVPWDGTRPDDPLAGVINFFLNRGIADRPLFEPGAGFHYSDTGFVLLGLLVESIERRPLHATLRARILEPLALEHTYLAYRDDPPLGKNRDPEADVHVGDRPLLSTGASLSFDWSGGGIVSNVAELSRFLRALMEGRLFRQPATLAQMTRWVRPAGLLPPRTGVGLGLFRTACDGAELWGHSGAWGTRLVFEPGTRMILAGTTNQARSAVDWHLPFVRAVLGRLANGTPDSDTGAGHE